MDTLQRETQLDHLYSQYWITVIFLNTITYIQKHIRGHMCRRRYRMRRQRIHYETYKDVMDDICQIGYAPPDIRYPLLHKGGYHYREAFLHFTYLKLSKK